MPCGSCGGGKAKAGTAFRVTFRGGEPQQVVDTLGEVRKLLSASSAGGSYMIVAKPTR